MSIARRARQGGYSLAEVLVVLFIVGLLSLVTVPSFLNYARSNRIKTSLRNVTSSIRAVRSLAVTKHEYALLTFDPSIKGIQRAGEFTVWEGTPDKDSPNDPSKASWKQTGPIHRLETGVYFINDTVNPIGDLFDGATWGTTDDKPDILFNPDGTISIAFGTFFVQTDFTNVSINKYQIDLTSAVSIATKGLHT